MSRRNVRRRLVLPAALTLALVLAGCGPPPADEVVPNAAPAQDGRWCAVLTDEEVGALIGTDQVERVRQSGELRRGPSGDCNVGWADDENYRRVATVTKVESIEPYGADVVFRRILPALGEDGHRLEGGTAVELGDGVYWWDDNLLVWTVLEADDGVPTVVELHLNVSDGLPGELSHDALAQIGERLRDMTQGVFEWGGETRPFQPEDLTAFLDAAEEADAIGPWRGHPYGE